MQLDRAVSHKLERNGMTIAITAVYNLDSDQSFYEVSKLLTGKPLEVFKVDTLAEAMPLYKSMGKEIGATDKDIYHSKVI
jgi:hypothetical protein